MSHSLVSDGNAILEGPVAWLRRYRIMKPSDGLVCFSCFKSGTSGIICTLNLCHFSTRCTKAAVLNRNG